MSATIQNNGVSRRSFLTTSGLTGAALCLGFYFKGNARNPTVIEGGEADALSIELNAWMSIDPSGKVTLVDHRAEMGQGSFQSVPQIIAEELEVDLKDVNVIFAPGNDKYGGQITGGSSTIRGSYKNLLNLSATAREMLVTAAAAKWNVPVDACYAQAGNVIHKPTGKKFHYGELVADASKLEKPKTVTLKKTSEYKLIRKPLRRRDTPLKTNGTAIFGLDKKIPGMKYAMVERNPRLRGTVKSFDDSATRKIAGVTHVFKVQMSVFSTLREGVAVVANTRWAAMQGRKLLKVEWDDNGFDHVDTAGIYQQMEDELKNKEGLPLKKQGDPATIIAQAANKIDVLYQTPYQAHACMEPLNCIAHYQKDKLEVWGPIQAPDWVQGFLSEQVKLPKEKVVVNMTFLGGGFGRKAFLDYPHEATIISKEIGAPVQVMWTREDDMTQGPHRPGMSYRCQGVVTNGAIEAAAFKMCGQNMDIWGGGDKNKPNESTAEAFLQPYFKSIKNISFNDVFFDTPLPIMWWRSVYASTNGFAYESFIDELAVAAGKDPLQFRRQHLPDDRVQKLLDKLEDVSGWKDRKQNEGYGVAITECFSSTVGQVVKVSKSDGGGVQVDHVWAVMDCGWYVNPDIIRAQVEGSIIMALGAATQHEITYSDGLTVEKNFYAYNLPRITDIPPIDVYIMENDGDAGGVGEPGLPAFSPALTNAIFDLTGKRIRKLPFNLADV